MKTRASLYKSNRTLCTAVEVGVCFGYAGGEDFADEGGDVFAVDYGGGEELVEFIAGVGVGAAASEGGGGKDFSPPPRRGLRSLLVC
ncbi:hypothetical protein LIER_43277 [Lithospermum erythrorhizon]|uniref:Uncharacterized protein n=1 Tax=Lithospermum erythrorhizon TaxID=34254 RepID=A0AAV3PU78_LITER